MTWGCSDAEIVKWFWEIIDQMKNDERLRLLQFVTVYSRAKS